MSEGQDHIINTYLYLENGFNQFFKDYIDEEISEGHTENFDDKNNCLQLVKTFLTDSTSFQTYKNGNKKATCFFALPLLVICSDITEKKSFFWKLNYPGFLGISYDQSDAKIGIYNKLIKNFIGSKKINKAGINFKVRHLIF